MLYFSFGNNLVGGMGNKGIDGGSGEVNNSPFTVILRKEKKK